MHNQNEERLALALEAAGMDLWENDLVSGTVTRHATRIFAELGYGTEETASRIDDLFSLIHPDDVVSVQNALNQHLQGKTERYRAEFRIRSKAGHWVWYANYGKIMDRDGNHRRFIGVTFNIHERKRTEERFRTVFDNVPVPLAMNNDQGKITCVNRAFTQSTGYDTQSTPDLQTWWLKAYPDPEYRQQIQQAWQASMTNIQATGISSPVEASVVCADGQVRIFLISPTQLKEDLGGIHLVVLYEVTEHKLAEAKLHRMSQLYKALSEINQGLLRMENEDYLFPLVCRTAVNLGGMMLAAIGRVNPADNRIQFTFSHGTGAEYLQGLVITLDASFPEGRGPSAIAYRERHNVIVNHFLDSEMTRPWHDNARRVGWNSSGTFPIMRAGKVFAIMIVYHRDAEAFDQQAVALLDEMIRDISFALDNFDREHERQISSVAVRESERHFRAYFERAMVGMAATSPSSSWLEVNDALCKMLGYSREELIRMTWIDVTHPDDLDENMRQVNRVLRDEIGEFEMDKRFIRKDRRTIYAHIAVRGVRSNVGKLEYFVIIVEDITELRNHQHQLEFLAHHDSLTGLPNRVLLNDRLDMAISQASRHGGSIAVCFMDLDNFKLINDTFGHATGDTLLVEAANRLTSISRATDTIARLGGDEFILILTELSGEAECASMLQRVIDAISKPFVIGGHEILISTSIGVAMYPDHVTDGTALLRHADQAMYVAKQLGRRRIHFFDAVHDHMAQVRSEGLSRIEQALNLHELVLYYQPQVNMRNGTVTGMEALIRWQHPQRGLLSPGEFLPLVENSEFENTLSEWVIREAMRQVSLWHKLGLNLTVSVNLPARHLLSRDFIGFISATMAAWPNIGQNILKLEILETAALGDIGSAIEKMERCIQTGVSFSLDDFGTGYASLSYLRRLPADTIKIDQSFVRDMLEDPNDLSIVKGVIGLADAFQKQVIAEGVETLEHGRELLAMGCESAQGYGIARPMPADTVADWIAGFHLPAEWSA